MPLRPDLVAVWIFRLRDPDDPGSIEILLLRRGPGRQLAGLWQCVTGSIEPGERVAAAAVRELAEETGFGAAEVETFYDLDLVSLFHWPGVDAVLAEVVFAAWVRPGVEPRISDEHDDARWEDPTEAIRLAVWPAYREAIERVAEIPHDRDRARWLETTLDGERVIR
jgi:8-oxo-dGTP pyrophosphatase MutT (NUDIX family)